MLCLIVSFNSGGKMEPIEQIFSELNKAINLIAVLQERNLDDGEPKDNGLDCILNIIDETLDFCYLTLKDINPKL
jgi:hypothetical protein